MGSVLLALAQALWDKRSDNETLVSRVGNSVTIVAAARAHLYARRSSAMKEHRLRHGSADLSPRRSQRARPDFCHGLPARRAT
jgi:hypothetical protein